MYATHTEFDPILAEADDDAMDPISPLEEVEIGDVDEDALPVDDDLAADEDDLEEDADETEDEEDM